MSVAVSLGTRTAILSAPSYREPWCTIASPSSTRGVAVQCRRCAVESPDAAESRAAEPVRSATSTGGSESRPFTLAYLKLCSSLNGTRMKLTSASPSAA